MERGRKIITTTKTIQTRLLPRMFDEMLKAYNEVPKIGATAWAKARTVY